MVTDSAYLWEPNADLRMAYRCQRTDLHEWLRCICHGYLQYICDDSNRPAVHCFTIWFLGQNLRSFFMTRRKKFFKEKHETSIKLFFFNACKNNLSTILNLTLLNVSPFHDGKHTKKEGEINSNIPHDIIHKTFLYKTQ